MTTRREFLSVWPALLLERPFDGTYGDGHLHDPSQIRGFFPDTTFLGDIRSFNWDGGSDLSTADTVATEGVFIDMSLGSGQWMGDFFIGGDFQLISGGAIYTDDPAGTTFIALSNAKAATIDFKSGGSDGSIDLAAGTMNLRVPTQYQWFVGGTVRAILSATTLSLTGPEVRLGGSDIVASGSDADTFIRPATDQWSIHAGGVEMLRLTESTTDVVNVGPSSEVDLQVGGSSVGRGVLGYAAVTADQTGIGAGITALTGLTTTVTVDASRRIKVTGFVSNWQITSGGAAADGSIFRIRETTTGLQDLFFNWAATPTGGNAYPGGTMMSVILTPSAGSHTYNLAHVRVFGTPTVSMLANAQWPAFILVEDIGSA